MKKRIIVVLVSLALILGWIFSEDKILRHLEGTISPESTSLSSENVQVNGAGANSIQPLPYRDAYGSARASSAIVPDPSLFPPLKQHPDYPPGKPYTPPPGSNQPPGDLEE